MAYHQEMPARWLRSTVAGFSWSTDEGPPFGPIRVLPDGCVDLMFSIDRNSGACRADVFGVKSRLLLVDDRSPMDKVAVHVRPGAFARLFGAPAWQLRDRAVSLEEFWPRLGAELADRMGDTISWDARKALLETALVRGADRCGDSASAPQAIDHAVRRIAAAGGQLAIEAVARELGLSVRTLERLFHHHVGLPPKLFARIARFRVALRAVGEGRSGAAVAAIAGFSDQPHLVREFRAFAGVTPGRLRA